MKRVRGENDPLAREGFSARDRESAEREERNDALAMHKVRPHPIHVV